MRVEEVEYPAEGAVAPIMIPGQLRKIEGPLAKEAFRLAAHKLSIPTITVQRRSVAHGS